MKFAVLLSLVLALGACGKATSPQEASPTSDAPLEYFKGVVAPFCFVSGVRVPCLDLTQDTGACGEIFTVGGPIALLHTELGAMPIPNGDYAWSNDGCVIHVQNYDTGAHP